MGKRERWTPLWARDPMPGMTIYGRDHAGNLGRIVVHRVEASSGRVFGAKRMRGWPCWTLCQWDSPAWHACQAGIIGVKMPRIVPPIGV